MYYQCSRLYPNVPDDESLLFLKKAIYKRAELVLKSNYFEFNDMFRIQKESTTIGTKFAPSYAIIFMVALEEEILESLLKKP